MSKSSEVPLSEYAKNKLGMLNCNYFEWQVIPGVLFAFILFLTILARLGGVRWNHGDPITWVFVGIMAVIFASVMAVFYLVPLLFIRRYFQKKREVYSDNLNDYNLSLDLNAALTGLVQPDLQSYPINEAQIPGEWTTFRVEHFPAQVLKGQFSAKVNIAGLLFGNKPNFGGETFQMSMSNLIETSTLLFAQNTEGKTVRLVIPSPTSLVGLVNKWLSRLKSNVSDGSYTMAVLENFSFEDWMTGPLQKAQMIDELNAELDKPIPQRTPFQVYGKEVQPGIVLASQLVVEGKQVLCIPTGFLQKFVDQIGATAQVVLQLPEVSSATV